MVAASNGYLDVVSFLIDNGAEIEAVNHNKTTALMFAVTQGQESVVHFLIEKGAL